MTRPALATLLLTTSVSAEPIPLAGEHVLPHSGLQAAGNYRLTAGLRLHLHGQTKIAGDFDLDGHHLHLDTGGGNPATLTGVLSGTGHLKFNGGGSTHFQLVQSVLGGTAPNTFSGHFNLWRGSLRLEKPPGTNAIAGDLSIGGGANQAILWLGGDHQIADTATLTTTGQHEARLRTQGHSETIGPLNVQAFTYLDLGEGSSHLRFADSSTQQWDLSKTVTISNWTSGQDSVVIANLTPAQLARIGFLRDDELYTTKISPDGTLQPDKKVAANDPPYDLSAASRNARRAIYQSTGMEKLADPQANIPTDTTIAFYGDSITWNNSYLNQIRTALEKSHPAVKLINHGVNGGGVLTLRDGDEGKAHFGDTQPLPIKTTLATDQPDIAVVFIGINDIWWRKTPPAEFEQALRDITATIKAANALPVLATLTVQGELPTGQNPSDPNCDQFAALTRKVARETGATLVDLRNVFLAYLKNHNIDLRVDGTLAFQKHGLLTYDGVHPTATGAKLIADHISAGIVKSLTLN